MLTLLSDPTWRNCPKFCTTKQSPLVFRSHNIITEPYFFLCSRDFSSVCVVKRDYGANVYVHTRTHALAHTHARTHTHTHTHRVNRGCRWRLLARSTPRPIYNRITPFAPVNRRLSEAQSRFRSFRVYIHFTTAVNLTMIPRTSGQ